MENEKQVYNFHTVKHDDGKYWIYESGKCLVCLDNFETEEAANRVIDILNKAD